MLLQSFAQNSNSCGARCVSNNFVIFVRSIQITIDAHRSRMSSERVLSGKWNIYCFPEIIAKRRRKQRAVHYCYQSWWTSSWFVVLCLEDCCYVHAFNLCWLHLFWIPRQSHNPVQLNHCYPIKLNIVLQFCWQISKFSSDVLVYCLLDWHDPSKSATWVRNQLGG